MTWPVWRNAITAPIMLAALSFGGVVPAGQVAAMACYGVGYFGPPVLADYRFDDRTYALASVAAHIAVESPAVSPPYVLVALDESRETKLVKRFGEVEATRG